MERTAHTMKFILEAIRSGPGCLSPRENIHACQSSIRDAAKNATGRSMSTLPSTKRENIFPGGPPVRPLFIRCDLWLALSRR